MRKFKFVRTASLTGVVVSWSLSFMALCSFFFLLFYSLIDKAAAFPLWNIFRIAVYVATFGVVCLVIFCCSLEENIS